MILGIYIPDVNDNDAILWQEFSVFTKGCHIPIIGILWMHTVNKFKKVHTIIYKYIIIYLRIHEIKYAV